MPKLPKKKLANCFNPEPKYLPQKAKIINTEARQIPTMLAIFLPFVILSVFKVLPPNQRVGNADIRRNAQYAQRRAPYLAATPTRGDFAVYRIIIL